jgi:hypothetical protein
MDDRLKVLRAISKEDGAIEFRIATDVVIVARIEALSGAVEPRLQRPEDAALKDRTGVARIGAVAKASAAFAIGSSLASLRAPAVGRGVANACSRSVLLIQIRRDVCGSNSTALSRLNAKVWF